MLTIALLYNTPVVSAVLLPTLYVRDSKNKNITRYITASRLEFVDSI